MIEKQEWLAGIMAKHVGHGMTEKCLKHAEAIMHLVGTEPETTQADVALNDLLSGINELISKFDKLENNNHESVDQCETLHLKDVFRAHGTTYGICAEELRILIGLST